MPRLRVRVSHLRLKDVSAIHFFASGARVGGSIPSPATNYRWLVKRYHALIVRLVYVGVVQLVEHFVANEDVAGPIPVIHSKGLPIVSCYWEVCQLWRAEFKYAPPFAASAVVETVIASTN